jgi:hypothetical protein
MLSVLKLLVLDGSVAELAFVPRHANRLIGRKGPVLVSPCWVVLKDLDKEFSKRAINKDRLTKSTFLAFFERYLGILSFPF